MRLSLSVFSATLLLSACTSARDHRLDADTAAYRIINDAQQQLTPNENESFTLERPSNVLRKKLLTEQGLLISGPASLGSEAVPQPKHWPDEQYPSSTEQRQIINESLRTDAPLNITLIDALQIAARNSHRYQSAKEDVFTSALALDLTRHNFGVLWNAENQTTLTANSTSGTHNDTLNNTTTLSASRSFTTGSSAGLAMDSNILRLLNSDGTSSIGLGIDGSISIPLLRGSGTHIAGEPLTLTERKMTYALLEFERFKREFAVSIVSGYLNALRTDDRVRNATDNAQRIQDASKRARALADAGRLPNIQVGLARQEELQSRDRLQSAIAQRDNTLDRFKITLGLPTDAHIVLDTDELQNMTSSVQPATTEDKNTEENTEKKANRQTESEITKHKESTYIQQAFQHRYDLYIAHAQVEDAQRAAIVAADNLRGELTLGASSSFSADYVLRDSSGNTTDNDFRSNRALHLAFLTIDLPLERTAERNSWRRSLIHVESRVRAAQALEDEIKLDIRTGLRALNQAQTSALIQEESLLLAQNRVESTQLFLQAGRSQVRDMLEAEQALIEARNALTSARVDERIAQLALQRDMGILSVHNNGLWDELSEKESPTVTPLHIGASH